MATFVFKPQPGLPRDKGGYRLLFRNGGRRAEPLPGGKNAMLVGPRWLYSGDEVEVSGALESAIRSRYSHVLHEKAPKKIKSASDDE